MNLGQFVQQFNDRTKEYNGTPIPVIVTVYNDRSFDFITKSPPAASMLMQSAGIAKGSGVPNKDKVATVTRAQCEEIAQKKMEDLNARGYFLLSDFSSMNFIEALFMQNRLPDGAGPSSNRCPRCAWQRLQCTSVRGYSIL